MKNTILSFLLLLSTLGAYGQTTATLRVPEKPTQTISRHIYGHFAEHLGRCIYGGFYVGESNTKIPHTAGVRNDVVDALKKLKIPNLRWPGGCFADTYHWKDGIGPKEQRPTIVNTWWGGVTENNSFGTHDFLNMCELLGTEPYLAGNMGSGAVQELADWVQYVNFAGVSPMSSLRKQNGREKPWKVNYWGIGNEAWGCGGNMTAEYYANEYRKYATFVSDWTNSGGLFRIASGANSGDYHWTETLMKNVPKNLIEGIALHHYAVIDWNKKGPSTKFEEKTYFGTMKSALRMEELVQKHSAIMDKYDPGKKIALVVDEWGGWYEVEPGTNPGFLYQQNTMRDAMIAGATLNIFNNHSDRVRMANLAQTINVLQAVILTEEEKMLLTPTYHVMEMYNVHQDATYLPLSLQSAAYTLGSEKLNAVSGSASRDKNGLTHVSLVNIDPKNKQEVTIAIEGANYKSVTGRILTSKTLQDHNTFAKPNLITPAAFKGANLKGNNLKVELPPFSVVVLEMK
ncbi:alpha-N-arabinofuranosidase [Rufibacter glacialis]|uniref:non-reducing end alpha-L-arabinofuranosidase n=1 Tax=Rufibacter glacialis TaxID=1259555 RepID=A0A5M8QM48_9BACT|nr:alpha-L-arabinofuranosidase C-terminal domain-containing protein [Rufibacter glacialis]KAA6437159.1 alpha-N-arabinofuranosidase [Rufibacter glacialis]GGK61675.1 alpha-N-arabinofuranosidase [Rufibacter glacialis]